MSFRFVLPDELRGAVDLAAADWTGNNKVDRFWQKDPSLWTRDGEENWMGWIDIVERQQRELSNLAELAADVETGGFKTVLAPGHGRFQPLPRGAGRDLRATAGLSRKLHIVDSTDPAQVKAVREQVEPEGNACNCGQQIRHHAGTEHPEAVFF